MTAGEFFGGVTLFLNVCAVYYTVQLVRCAFLSFAVFGIVLLLRKILPKNRVFLKGALWCLFIPVLFAGKMKFFYENGIGVKLFSWQTDILMNHTWICWLYLCGAAVYAVLLIRGRIRLKKAVRRMEKRNVDGTFIRVSDMPVTPSAVGAVRPEIVMPEIILKEYGEKELSTVFLHEKTHIRLGHLRLYLLWDIFRALLWINPLLTVGTKLLREDMEEICDWVTIRKSGESAYDYGQLLLKSIRLLRAESGDFNTCAAFAGNREYRNIRRRITAIAGYKPRGKIVTAAVPIAALLTAAGAVFCMMSVSYGRYNPYGAVAVYDAETETLYENVETLREAVRCDENYAYIERKALTEFVEDSGISGEIHIYFGVYYKLPGIGGGGSFGYLEAADLTESEENVIQMECVKTQDILCSIFKLL